MLLTAACGTGAPESMAIGSPAPDSRCRAPTASYPRLSDYSSSRVLAVAFTCNHCPGVRALRSADREAPRGLPEPGRCRSGDQPDNPKALRLDELSHTDVGDSLDDIKLRAVSTGALPTRTSRAARPVAKQFKVVATPQIFVFDKDRTLRYQGRIDNHAREYAVTSRDARNAIDVLLAGRPVPVAGTAAVGCPPAYLSKPARRTGGRAGRDCGRTRDARHGGRRRAEEAAGARTGSC